MKVPNLKCVLWWKLMCALVKIYQIPPVIFQTTSQFFFKFCMTLWCHEIYLLRSFSGQRLYTLHKRDQSKCKFFRSFSAWIKIHQILVNLKQKISFFFKFCTTPWYHEIPKSGANFEELITLKNVFLPYFF